MSYSIKSQLQEEKEARLNKTPEEEARGNMKLMYVEEKNEQRKRTFVLKKREEKASWRTRKKAVGMSQNVCE